MNNPTRSVAIIMMTKLATGRIGVYRRVHIHDFYHSAIIPCSTITRGILALSKCNSTAIGVVR